MITGETPGLTRDAVHIEWEFNNRTIRLVDTAGIYVYVYIHIHIYIYTYIYIYVHICICI
jgi:predicted GTPase